MKRPASNHSIPLMPTISETNKIEYKQEQSQQLQFERHTQKLLILKYQ